MLYLLLTTHIGLAHTAWKGRFQTDPSLQISALISSSSSKRHLVPAEKNNLVILHNFADLLAAFIPLDMNITVVFLEASKIQSVQRHRILMAYYQ